MLWIDAPLDWPGFGKLEAAIYYAPTDSYRRLKMLEGDGSFAVTGDKDFDSEYLIVGDGRCELAQAVPDEARQALLGAVDLVPDVLPCRFDFALGQVEPLPHVHSTPDPSHDSRSLLVDITLGDERLTPGVLW